MTSTAGAMTANELSPQPVQVFPGVWKFTLGVPENITPQSTRYYPIASDALQALPHVDECPIVVTGAGSSRGYVVQLPLAPYELVYGLGLQMHSFQQRGLKKKLRVNADPQMDSGDSHAPVPFYVTTSGYGVFVDTARYATFYCGNKHRRPEELSAGREEDVSGATIINGPNTLPSAYAQFRINEPSEVLVEIPQAQGVDVYILAGPGMREAVQRYNLFAGGGPLPPRWGLGFWYRCKTEFSQDGVLQMASELRERRIPCDVLGLEPGWQTHAYSCSYAWSQEFPAPSTMLQELRAQHFQVNLWEHAFTSPASPIYESLAPHSGEYEVWGGLVPDFMTPEARRIFADFHETEHVEPGVSGYKMDECDNSDFTGNWSFPEVSRFPSGADGEQMHSLFGLRYQDAIQSIFEKRKQRTYGLVRCAHALAAPYPYVLYSDLYNHRDFIRCVAQSSFSGLLWTPEVRDATGPEDLIRRLQSVVFSPLAMVNAWYLTNPPWKQVNTESNNAGEFAPGWERTEALCREVIELRMRLIPYLHAAFVRYHREGLPPFRALVMDYPDDPEVWTIDDQYMVGESLLVAPVIAGESGRSVYLPQGEWFDFWDGKCYTGNQKIDVDVTLERIPVYVKSGAILPLAQPTLHTGDSASRQLTVRVFGRGATPAKIYEDDGSWNSRPDEVRLEWDHATQSGHVSKPHSDNSTGYEVVRWQVVSSPEES